MLLRRLYDLREDNDFKQREIACLLHITQSGYSSYETGQRTIPLESLIALAKFYGVSVDYILELTDEPKSKSHCHSEHPPPLSF